MMSAPNSLVMYDSPILVSTTSSKDVRAGKKKGGAGEPKSDLTPTEDILNSILPPREWTEDGQLWVQYVSSTPATRSDVISLQDKLEQKLQQRQARETGICPIREELYSQCFDELIRQVTINCAERGLLLLRVRDEIRMTIACYQTLYESSVAFGMRKALQSEQGRVEMQNSVKAMESETKELERQVSDMKSKCEALERREAERRREELNKHRDEVEMMKKQNASLKRELEQLLSAPGSSTATGGASDSKAQGK